jgi:hypothetical protein
VLASGAAILGTGCNKNQGPNPAAYGNLAPVGQGENAYPPPSQGENAYPPPGQGGYPAGEAGRYVPPASGNVQLATAPQPPPPLPEYKQPQCPGSNYIWTPGYWGYGDVGYYWVPGAWIVAPYIGALWTPPWWEFYGAGFRWHHGYWGRYIGFYGGINYGYGYTGLGFDGGYWNNGQFYYNRAAANVDPRVTPYVYRYSISNYTPFNRVSYNGGPGVNRQATARELAMRPGMRTAPVAEQMRNVRAAAADPRQFASGNHGRPATTALAGSAAMSNRNPAAAPAARFGQASRMQQMPAQRTTPGRTSTSRAAVRAGTRQGRPTRAAQRRAAAHGSRRGTAPRGHAVARARAPARTARAARPPARAGFHGGGHGGGHAGPAFGRGGHGFGGGGGGHFGGGGGGHGRGGGGGHGGGRR